MTAVALERSKTYFEQFVAGVPEPLQGFTRAVLRPFEELLEMVAGDPDDLMRAAQVFLNAGSAVGAIGDQQYRDRQALRPPAWGGPASEAFHGTMTDVEETIRQLAEGLTATKDLLVEAANAAVDAFNLLLELIFEFLAAFLIEAIIAAAAAVLSMGASIAAFIARWLARLGFTIARGARIVMRLVRALIKVARRLDDVVKLLTTYRKRVMELRKLKKQFALWKSEGRSAAGAQCWQEYATKVIAPKMAFNLVSPVNLPGKFGATLDTAVGAHDISDGRKDRNYVRDGTYRDDLGPYTRGAQDLLDTMW